MLADPRMRTVNGDLLGILELIETGLLPVPDARAAAQGAVEA